jgi:hypothetical protein
MPDENPCIQLKKQQKEDPGFLIPIRIYTTYLITIVDDGEQERSLPLKKHNLLCGAVG